MSFSSKRGPLSPYARPLVILCLGLAAMFLPTLVSRSFADDIRRSDEPRGAVTRPSAGPLGPHDLVQSSVSRVQAIVRSRPVGDPDRRAEIIRVAHDLFDFDEMARRALGRHWRDLSLPERDEFVRLFTDVIEQFYVTAADVYAGQTVAFQGDEITATYAQVRFRLIATHGPGISIRYQLSESGSRWRVYDVLVDGVSLVSNYRSQFNAIIRTSSSTQLLERMRTDRSRHGEPGRAIESARILQSAPSTRERLVTGLIVVMQWFARRL